MRITDNKIQEQLLDRAIREINELASQIQQCRVCPRGSLMPVLGSGHPQADILMLKYAPATTEIDEGVAFYGAAGSALMKAFNRLGIDPLTVYGTLCMKCPVVDPSYADSDCINHLAHEIAVVAPRVIVVMGEPALDCLNRIDIPLSSRVKPNYGEIQQLTPTTELLYVPDIDLSLSDEQAKLTFWQAFRELGEWYAKLPPY